MDSVLNKLYSNDEETISLVLEELTNDILQKFAFPELNEHEYRANLWKSLYCILKNESFKEFHKSCLRIIRIISREKKELNELVTEDYLNLILRHAGLIGDKNIGETRNHEIAVEALMCLCNITFNAIVPRAICCKNSTLEGILKRLQFCRDVSLEIRHFDMKILFIITALCTEIRGKLKDEMNCLPYLSESLKITLNMTNKSNGNVDVTEENHKLSTQDVNLSVETLKVLFNLTLRTKYEDAIDEDEDRFYSNLTSTLRNFLLVETEDPDKKLELDGHIINLLLNVPDSHLYLLKTPLKNNDVTSTDRQYEENDMSTIYEILRYLKSRFAPEPGVTNQNEIFSPVLTAITKLAKSDRIMRKYLRRQILPPLRDIHTRPEQGNTIRNCLCRLLTSPITQVSTLAADFIFVLCKENVGRMIKYTGYGNAAGMFATRGLLNGQNGNTEMYSSDSENSDTEEYNEFKHGINPVTGCYQEPKPSPTANMTEEQKEYEAMKLVELMDNLTKKGIVKPCRIGADGKPEPIDHVLQLQEGLQSKLGLRDEDDYN